MTAKELAKLMEDFLNNSPGAGAKIVGEIARLKDELAKARELEEFNDKECDLALKAEVGERQAKAEVERLKKKNAATSRLLHELEAENRRAALQGQAAMEDEDEEVRHWRTIRDAYPQATGERVVEVLNASCAHADKWKAAELYERIPLCDMVDALRGKEQP